MVVRLNALGRPHITRDGGVEVALQPLPVAVLTYLVVGGPRDRGHLADLFWPNNKNGLNSLSTTLNRIRADVPDGVWVSGNTLVGSDLASDVGDLHDAIDRSDFDSLLHLCGPPFLGGLKLRRQSAEFEEWVLETRTTIASMIELALLHRGRDLYDAGELRAAAVVAEQAWEMTIRDGFPSPDYFEAYHRILAAAGRPSANAVRSMADEFGIALLPVEAVAFESNSAVAGPEVHLAASFAGSLPAAVAGAAQLFGREEELDAIASSVGSQRLTTVVGLGGSGKTRLVAEFFNSPDVERDFALRYWVNLRDVTDHDLVGPAIAAAMGQKFDDVASLANRLPDDKSVLIVFDNFEQVSEAAGVATELLDGNGALRILVTSRVPLEVATEALVQLTGLATSDDEIDSPAEQLFMASARRAGAGNDRLSGSNRAAIRDVCRRVGGNPLALEIAGAWAQILLPAEILDALALSNELLGSPMIGDQRTIDAVLTQSWSTLAEGEQDTLMLLATFPGGVLTKEALKLRQLPIRSIGRLVQHSLVRLHVEGRITLHPLIAGHALSELEQRPDLQREFHRVLSGWCQGFALAAQADSARPHSLAFEAEIANLTSAWSWDARHRLWELHRTTLGPLRRFFTESGRVSEGRALFAMAAEAMRSDPDHPEDLLAAILEVLGWFQMLSGHVAEARTHLDEALVIDPAGRPEARAEVLRTLGALQLTTGDIDEATANFDKGLALIADEPSALTASLQHYLAQAHSYRGDRERASAAARSALQAGRSINDSGVMTRAYLLLADIEVESDPQRAIVLLNEGWAIAKEASLDHLSIYFPSILGLAHLNLGETELAEKYFTDGMKSADDVGASSTLGANYVGRAEARLLRDETAGAIDDLKTGIRLALKTGSGRYLMWAAVVSCRASAADPGLKSQAKDLLSLTLSHPAADQDARDKAVRTWQDFFDHAVPVAANADPAAELDEVAERSLELLVLAE